MSDDERGFGWIAEHGPRYAFILLKALYSNQKYSSSSNRAPLPTQESLYGGRDKRSDRDGGGDRRRRYDDEEPPPLFSIHRAKVWFIYFLLRNKIINLITRHHIQS